MSPSIIFASAMFCGFLTHWVWRVRGWLRGPTETPYWTPCCAIPPALLGILNASPAALADPWLFDLARLAIGMTFLVELIHGFGIMGRRRRSTVVGVLLVIAFTLYGFRWRILPLSAADPWRSPLGGIALVRIRGWGPMTQLRFVPVPKRMIGSSSSLSRWQEGRAVFAPAAGRVGSIDQGRVDLEVANWGRISIGPLAQDTIQCDVGDELVAGVPLGLLSATDGSGLTVEFDAQHWVVPGFTNAQCGRWLAYELDGDRLTNNAYLMSNSGIGFTHP